LIAVALPWTEMRIRCLSNPRLSPHIESILAWLTVVIGEDYYHHPLTDGRLLLAPFMITLFTSGHGYPRRNQIIGDRCKPFTSLTIILFLFCLKKWMKYQQTHL
jgi:hypothetical protein